MKMNNIKLSKRNTVFIRMRHYVDLGSQSIDDLIPNIEKEIITRRRV